MRSLLCRPLLALLALLAAASTGCVPPGLAWLPDSSGFVYTGAKGKEKFELRLFDVRAKKSCALADVGFLCWPGVSPDGKRVAVAWPGRNAEQEPFTTVLVVDLSGKVVHRSGELKTPGGDGLQLCWSPRGDKLLLTEEFWSRLYDLPTGKLTRLAGPAAIFGTSPVRPDGQAFVVHNWEEYRLVDWDGKEQVIKPGFAALVKKDDQQRRGRLDHPVYAHAGWEGPVAHINGSDSRFRIDTDRLTLTEEAHPMPRTAYGWLVPLRHTFPKGEVVRLVGGVTDIKSTHLELVRPGRDAEILAVNATEAQFFPSPDGKFLAIHSPEAREGRILVLDANANEVADLKLVE